MVGLECTFILKVGECHVRYVRNFCVQHPAGMYAKVVQAKTDNEKYVYTLKILDKTLNVDNDFPEIPNVKSSIMAQKEDIVVVLLLYGGSDVFVLGRCER